MADDRSSVDLFGTRPIAEAVSTVAKAGVDGASAFLGRICLPAAEEFGLLLRDKVGGWRAQNAINLTLKAERLSREQSLPADHHAHPRLVGQILESGSWSDSDEVQDLWAGLLASSCDASGRDESNLMFVDLLTRMTVSQVRVINHAVVHAEKELSPAGWTTSSLYSIDSAALLAVSGLADIHQLDRELDHLRALGLIGPMSGFHPRTTDADLTPSALALQMYARGHGHRGDPAAYFGLAQPAP